MHSDFVLSSDISSRNRGKRVFFKLFYCCSIIVLNNGIKNVISRMSTAGPQITLFLFPTRFNADEML